MGWAGLVRPNRLGWTQPKKCWADFSPKCIGPISAQKLLSSSGPDPAQKTGLGQDQPGPAAKRAGGIKNARMREKKGYLARRRWWRCRCWCCWRRRQRRLTLGRRQWRYCFQWPRGRFFLLPCPPFPFPLVFSPFFFFFGFLSPFFSFLSVLSSSSSPSLSFGFSFSSNSPLFFFVFFPPSVLLSSPVFLGFYL